MISQPTKYRKRLAAVSELIIWTYDWVPVGVRGLVRDMRLRWACEEAGLSYAVRTVPFEGRETNHLARQPFGHRAAQNSSAADDNGGLSGEAEEFFEIGIH